MFVVNNKINRGEWGCILKGKNNIVTLKQNFYTLIGYPSFLRPLRQTLRIGKESNQYFAHVADLVHLFNSSKGQTEGKNYTILSSLQYYLENAYLDPTGALVIRDLLDCIYTNKNITFEKYRYAIKTTQELFEEVTKMEIPEKNYYNQTPLNNRGNTKILTLQDEMSILFQKLGLKGIVTLAEVLCSVVYIKD